MVHQFRLFALTLALALSLTLGFDQGLAASAQAETAFPVIGLAASTEGGAISRLLDKDGVPSVGPKKGDVYILWGDLSRRWTKDEYVKIYQLVTWLSAKGYRAIVNPVAYEADIRDAVSRSGVAGIIWSSHGSDDGVIYDSADHAVERDAFSRGARRTFRHLVMGNCYGTVSTEYYRLPKGVTPHVWEGEATTAGFFRYLNSEKWRRDFVRDLER